MDEILTQVTEDDVVIGPITRKVCHGNPFLIHRSVHIMVINSAGNLLLQKRSMGKDTQPGKWDTSVGGHVGYGQSYEEAAHREAEEELGIIPDGMEFLYDSRIRNSMESENIKTYLLRCDGPFQLEAGEIDELRLWSRKQIKSSIGLGIFTPNFEEEFQLFCQSRWGQLLL